MASHRLDEILWEIFVNKPIDEELNDPFTDLGSYLSGMAKGVSDKLFFLHHIKPDLIVDFGSANGYVLSQIHQSNPSIALIGYDISPEMIGASTSSYPNIKFTNNWSEVASNVHKYKSPTLLLSSVIHEVYSYSSPDGVTQFWNNIFNAGFEFIVIRDTIPSENLQKVFNFKKDVERVKKVADPELVKDYEAKWGSIDKDYKNFVRFVLMYRYKENWSRERLEDYLPLTYEAILNKIMPEYGKTYKIIYEKRFKFKPIQSSFSKDFDIPLRDDIHLKMILRRK
jgi:hypothetical protein